MKKLTEVVYPETFKRYNIKDLKAMYHQIVEDDGIERAVKCVEFTVVLKNTEYVNWARYDDFAKYNPDVKMPDID